jgi:glycosyltransferase involved in cell wall biosynthesis
LITLFVAWASDHTRTRLLARAVGAETVFIWCLGKVRGWRLAAKYACQTARTAAVLLRMRPRVLLIQTPPVFPAVLATLYARVWRKTIVILDTHSGTLLSDKWRWSVGLHRWCARRASLNVLHVPSLARQVAAWNAKTLWISYTGEPERSQVEPYPLPAGINVAVPSSFLPDEPVEALFEAAQLLPDITFHVTGNSGRLAPNLRQNPPANLRLTGFLSTGAYYGLLGAADAVLVLTTQAQTLQWGGIEAVWFGRPLVTSDWEDLRHIFTSGTVFVQNTPASIAEGVRQALQHRSRLRDEMRQLKLDMETHWRHGLRELKLVIPDPD